MRGEILAPAGDESSARAAISGGADAVYLGLTRFSAREGAGNFDAAPLKELITHAHLLGVKVYVCLNTLVKDAELGEFVRSVRDAWKAGADALLLQDLLLGKRLKELFPELVLHLSTQAGCCNVRGALFAKECGFSRVVLARETPLSEIAKISAVIETEVFVQGALCTCFSGQCYLSSFAGNNSGNRGRCKQPCRKRYKLDRRGFEEFAYALSPADLSVGRRVKELLAAGVTSLKIEGRMRRPEYVAAAVRYYRALLRGEEAGRELSDLKRAYNRGDYTEGLAFGQAPGFLSRNVQGHIGERVGYMRDSRFCASEYAACPGDGFKILREGREVGGALFRARERGGFTLSSSEKLRAGDEVRLTTEAAQKERLTFDRRREICLRLRFVGGEPAQIVCGDLSFEGAAPEAAQRAPLTREALEDCFLKTDGLPFSVRFERVETAHAFLPKSALNAIRRQFYAALAAHLLPRRAPLGEGMPEAELVCAENRKLAVITSDPAGVKADVIICKPADYRNVAAPETSGEKFLYLPPFFTEEDEALILPVLPRFDGIYCDGYYGLSLAREYQMPFFAGTGWNLTNRVSVSELLRAGVKYFALSKELSGAEQRALAAEGAFTLCLGSVKVMDLVHCPFSRTCADCDRRRRYTLEDEEGRRFPLLRYRAAGEGCRFELYNCAPLSADSAAGRLVDLSAEDRFLPEWTDDPAAAPLAGKTKGHYFRSML